LAFLDFLSDLDASDRIAIVAAVVALISAIAAVRANGIARAANKLAADANSISGESNSIARGGNQISEQARPCGGSVELEEAAHADRDRERTARAVLTAETKVESVVARTIAAMSDPLISPEAHARPHQDRRVVQRQRGQRRSRCRNRGGGPRGDRCPWTRPRNSSIALSASKARVTSDCGDYSRSFQRQRGAHRDARRRAIGLLIAEHVGWGPTWRPPAESA
jgi:hypothetical protein